ncbi:six-hairpin glycosidase [Phanerochaete sordida]|uniref:Six-hairpin glycosidase n=1 Tax=Phanerochaete sordida TaxID=48140 RepID=A0A9P3FWJ6_9APHY|nr:six-hairpin glycosidase [Phanerochaete sordida]
MKFISALLLLLAACLASSLPVIQVGFNDVTIDKVEANMLQIATHSWELGTAAEALTELLAPSLSVFRSAAFPPPTSVTPADGNTTAMMNIAVTTVKQKPMNSMTLIDGDGAVGDPASLGVAVLLANWTRSDPADQSFAQAARSQLAYLTTVAPRTSDGAISHRASEVQLWADFVYMAPPFIAYFGALAGGSSETTLLQLAYDQCRLYRNYLRDDNGLWKHIVLGDQASQDFRHWGTGNAWAAAGMMRVLQTIMHSNQARQFDAQQADLTAWITEILAATWQHQQPSGTLTNVIDDSTTFPDSSSTALLAAVTYRLAVLTADYSLVAPANRALNYIRQNVNGDGWLLNTVDPETFNTPSKPGEYSPEGQAFVLLLHAAWKDFGASLSGTLPH